MVKAHIERPSDRVPPTPADRIRLFLASVDQYEAMSNAFPLPHKISYMNSEPSVRWTAIFHAMLLRKYLMRSDELYLRKVADAVEACAIGAPLGLDVMLLNFRDDVDYFRDVGGGWRQQLPEGGQATVSDMILEDLYGGLMHGDYGRWQRTHPDSSMASAIMWEWSCDVSRLVVFLRDQLRGRIDRSEIEMSDPEAAV